MKLSDMSNEQFGLLFDIRRSLRYHDRRRAFFERLHRVTNLFTILMAGSVLHELGRSGEPAWWLVAAAAVAAVLAAADMVVGFSAAAAAHRVLRSRFAELEIDIFSGGSDEDCWKAHRVKRLGIERDEPPVYRALDLLCHNELAAADGWKRKEYPEHFSTLTPWQRFTCHFLMWPDLGPG